MLPCCSILKDSNNLSLVFLHPQKFNQQGFTKIWWKNTTLCDQSETNPPFTHTFTELSFEFPSVYGNSEWGCRDVSVSPLQILWNCNEFCNEQKYCNLKVHLGDIRKKAHWKMRIKVIQACPIQLKEWGLISTNHALTGINSWWQIVPEKRNSPKHFPGKKKHACKATRDHPAEPVIRAVAHQCPKFGSKPPLWDATRCPSAWTTGRTNGGVFLLKM